MGRWSFVAALLVSLGVCGYAEYRAQEKYAETQRQIAARKAELQQLSDLDQRIQAYKKLKDTLQRRIDILQQLSKGSAH